MDTLAQTPAPAPTPIAVLEAAFAAFRYTLLDMAQDAGMYGTGLRDMGARERAYYLRTTRKPKWDECPAACWALLEQAQELGLSETKVEALADECMQWAGEAEQERWLDAHSESFQE